MSGTVVRRGRLISLSLSSHGSRCTTRSVLSKTISIASTNVEEAVREARAWLDAKYESGYLPPPYYKESHWAVPISSEVMEGMRTQFANPDSYPADGRGVAYTSCVLGSGLNGLPFSIPIDLS
jgi:hypothetical protein